MKTRITNIVKYLLASVAVLVSAVCANAQDYAYPPVDAVVVTPGASGVRVDWGFPIAPISDDYQFAVVTYSKRVEGDITYYDMVSSDTVSSTTHSVYASIIEDEEYVAGKDYYARVTPISSGRAHRPRRRPSAPGPGPPAPHSPPGPLRSWSSPFPWRWTR